VVLAHLNHRLVQMCLRLLRAEVWASSGRRAIHRVSAQRLPSGTRWQNPLVIAHGRIVVLGGDHHRLHEEVIMAGGEIRAGQFARLTVGDTREAYAAATLQPAPEGTCQRLAALWPQHGEPLLRALEVRMRERTRNLEDKLQERAEQEVAKFEAVLKELQKAIEQELKADVSPQMPLWTDEEQAQRERDVQGLQRRLREIPGEMQREADHLRARFRDPSPRLFPMAVTYLVPPAALRG
jgi:hypothetical protein